MTGNLHDEHVTDDWRLLVEDHRRLWVWPLSEPLRRAAACRAIALRAYDTDRDLADEALNACEMWHWAAEIQATQGQQAAMDYLHQVLPVGYGGGSL